MGGAVISPGPETELAARAVLALDDESTDRNGLDLRNPLALRTMTTNSTIPEGQILVTYGGGVNTIANLILVRRLGLVPRVIVMAFPGHERTRTIWYRDEIMAPWLAGAGFPTVTVVSRWEEILHRTKFKNVETLGGLCERTAGLPSVAYGWKRCSFNFKRAPSVWWAERQEWCRKEWAAGRKIVKAIGYDMDEPQRARPGFDDPVENARYVPWYPLLDAGLDRAGCEALIASEGLPSPGKSACTFCPNNTLREWEEVRRDDPEAFAYALEMSRRAAPGLQNPDTTGLMRCNPKGKRQLHVWTEGGYPGLLPASEADDAEVQSTTPCECAL